MVFGYARVSTSDQNLDRQLDALKQYGIDELFMEKISGRQKSRPELDRLVDKLRPGDVVVIESLSRLARSTRDLLALSSLFREKSVQLVSLKEAITEGPMGDMLLTVLAAISQFEVDLIRQRTREGLEAARSRGRKGGRKPIAKGKIDSAIKLYHQGSTVSEITELTGVSKTTLYRYLSAEKNEKGKG